MSAEQSKKENTGPQRLQPQTQSTESSAAPELAAAVDELLDQLQNKFDNVSTEVFGKLDDMARRLDDLETSLNSSAREDAAAKT
ncbi:uncharacterized protein TRUGW13939_06404 [Talaromyces rugulosus]|uniref:Uncharacterized protein n=1 Tax=Talaromyces rugulosus TaxID=121627 RepID=A0A7H8QYW2_TALRU|nr:uncharacterized protein TRUGW13939_06404 [Talaromyces rugulosus]QKX59272.1 hypothetical protein TRUGW13939_06404 [Talaromyces rugulosus]